MTTQTQTLVQSITNALMNGKIQSENDLVIMARVVMTDLQVNFTTALRFINNVVSSVIDAQNQLLSA